MSDYSDLILSDSPVAYWRLGESSGTTLFDETANSYDLTTGGSPTLGATGLLVGDADTAVTFNGTSQYATIPSGVLNGVTQFTVEAWLESQNSTAETRPISFNSDTVYVSFRVNAGGVSGALRVFVYTTGTSGDITISSVDFSAINHIVLTAVQAGLCAVYVNGSLAGSMSMTGTFQLTSSIGSNLGAARDALANFYSGTIDEVAVYDYALSAAEVLEHYETGIGLQAATAPFISSGNIVYAPTAEYSAPDAAAAPFISAGTTVYAPTVSGGPVTATVGFIASGATVHAATAAPVAVSVSAPYLDSSTIIYSPVVANEDPWIPVLNVSTTWTEIN